jgi:hypothetical protein
LGGQRLPEEGVVAHERQLQERLLAPDDSTYVELITEIADTSMDATEALTLVGLRDRVDHGNTAPR